MSRLNQYHQFFLLDASNMVELSDVQDTHWIKEARVVNAALPKGTRTLGIWRQASLDQLEGALKQQYDMLLEAECASMVPEQEYALAGLLWGGFTEHRLQRYADRWVYHAWGGVCGDERVVVSANIDLMIHHGKGIGRLYNELVKHQAK